MWLTFWKDYPDELVRDSIVPSLEVRLHGSVWSHDQFARTCRDVEWVLGVVVVVVVAILLGC